MATSASSSVNPALLSAKLDALVRDLGVPDAPPASGGGGGSVTCHDGVGYVLTSPASKVRALGPAWLWALKNGLSELVMFDDDHAPDLARRAALLNTIKTSVRQIAGTSSQVAVSNLLPSPPSLDHKVLDLSDAFAQAGAIPVDDYGRLVAEVNGLEVARAFIDDSAEAEMAGRAEGLVIEVGVGQADRELHQLVHSNLGTVEAVSRAAEMVSAIRSPGAEPHPLNRLGRARWLRSEAVADPGIVGVGSLTPVPPLRWRDTVLGIEPACAVSESSVVVFSAGVDPDLVPEALEYRYRANPDAELVIVMAERDVLPTVDRLIQLCPNAQLMTVTTPWS